MMKQETPSLAFSAGQADFQREICDTGAAGL